ncbi:hypothetical protein [Flavonifractor hominis]|uniref:Lipoprotein n=1 Tax=Flavonifractor hominis TaxID=3133178 RepID=A0ABV1ERC2_9FIRM
MKRMLIGVFTIACVLGLSGCQSKGAVTETSTPVSHPTGTSWSEQDIVSMFSQVKKNDWEYIDCVLISDYASDCVGAVLFWDDEKETSNVAFFDADGFYQQCGTYAKMSANPAFTYLGDGCVTYELEKEDGTTYHYTLTISIDGNNVNFKAEDDFLKQQ